MTPRTAGTEEGREREKVNTDHSVRGKKTWLLPLLLAVPFLAVIAFGAVRFGPVLTQILSAAVKAVVVQ